MLAEAQTVEFIGEITDAQKSEFLGNAAGLLFPIDWPEPFGLVMIEAMACGTPIIALNRGAVPEVIEDGITGFVVDDLDAAVAAVGRLPEIDRADVRDSFERRFTVAVMAAGYEAAYEHVLMQEATATDLDTGVIARLQAAIREMPALPVATENAA